MQKLIEKVLTDKSARDTAKMEAIAVKSVGAEQPWASE